MGEGGRRSLTDEVLRSTHNEKVAKEVAYSSSASLRSAPSPAGEGYSWLPQWGRIFDPYQKIFFLSFSGVTSLILIFFYDYYCDYDCEYEYDYEYDYDYDYEA